MRPKGAIYVGTLSVPSLFTVLRSGWRGKKIRYFGKTRAGDALGRALAGLGLVKGKPEEVDFQLSDARDSNGECLFFKISEDVNRICVEHIRKHLCERRVLKGLGRHFPLPDLLHFIIKTIEQEIRETVIFINIADWKEAGGGKEPALFLMEKGLWSKHIELYMRRRTGIKLIQYRSMNFLNWGYYLPRLWKRLKAPPGGIARGKLPGALNPGRRKRDRPSIAHWYTGKTITFDPGLRCDFFWFLNSGIDKDDLVVCFEKARPDHPAITALAEHGLEHEVCGPAPLLRSAEHRKRALKVFSIATRNWLTSGPRVDSFALFYFASMFSFASSYARWSVFFRRRNIKVSINQNDLGRQHVPMKLALKENGGVSVSYQWSNLRAAAVSMSGCSDVMFSFGPTYDFFWERTLAPIGYLIKCGYITDHAFKKVRGPAASLREGLRASGAEFIICFFDENSSNDRFSLITDQASAEVHRRLLERVLEDGSLGLILKPGYPNTFYQRMASIKGLIDKALSTGRCVVMDKGQYLKTDKYPAEAAQAADLAIGLLLSGTAALESFLSGTKTVLLDLEGLVSDPVYGWGKGKAVFEDLDELFAAIEGFRSGKGPEGFGDLSRWVLERDCFRDGGASFRIGQYVGWLFEKLKEGSGREDALAYANSMYAGRWGNGQIKKWE